MKTSITFIIFFISPFVLLAQWTQIGNDIDGDVLNDQSGSV